MATFEDLKESCDKFVETLDKIMNDSHLEDDEAFDKIETENQSFKGYLDGIVNDAGTPEEVEDYEKGGTMDEILRGVNFKNLKDV